MANLQVPITKSFVSSVYDIETFIRFHIKGRRSDRIDIDRMEYLDQNLRWPATLNTLRTRTYESILQFNKSFRASMFMPFPSMKQQLMWLYEALNDESPQLQLAVYDKIEKAVRILAVYCILHCGCLPIEQNWKPDAKKHLKGSFIAEHKGPDLTLTPMVTKEELIAAIIEPQTVIGSCRRVWVVPTWITKISRN